MRLIASAVLVVSVLLLADGGGGGASADDSGPTAARCQIVGPATGLVPVPDLIHRTYAGFTGGLYPNCSNLVLGVHDSLGLAAARSVQPLDGGGVPSGSGKVVLLSIGMSNTTQEFCSFNSLRPCDSWTFMGQAAADAAVNHTTLAIVNGARGGQTADQWLVPTAPNYDRIRDLWLIPNGLTERQVQVAWVKVANAFPTASLPAAAADAYLLESHLGSIVRALKARYPNLQMVFFSSRVYGGYAGALNPEPYAYESAFAVKRLIEAQIAQTDSGRVLDTRAGDLGLSADAPWLGWAAYLWANGTAPRADGLTWTRDDFESDGVHPSPSGEAKVGGLLLTFFKESRYTKCWFVTGGTCP